MNQHPCHNASGMLDCPDANFKQGVLTGLSAIGARLDILTKAVEGNGQPGLRQRVEALERGSSTSAGEKKAQAAMWASGLTLLGIIVHTLMTMLK